VEGPRTRSKALLPTSPHSGATLPTGARPTGLTRFACPCSGFALPFCKTKFGGGGPARRRGGGEASRGRGQRPRLGARSSGRRVARRDTKCPTGGRAKPFNALPLGGARDGIAVTAPFRFDIYLTAVVVDLAGPLVSDLAASAIGRCSRRAATGRAGDRFDAEVVDRHGRSLSLVLPAGPHESRSDS